MAWLPIRYRDFYDVPRMFVVELPRAVYFFDGRFDDAADEYPQAYRVYQLPPGRAADEPRSWDGLERLGHLVAEVPVPSVLFDPSRRAAVDDAVLQALG